MTQLLDTVRTYANSVGGNQTAINDVVNSDGLVHRDIKPQLRCWTR